MDMDNLTVNCVYIHQLSQSGATADQLLSVAAAAQLSGCEYSEGVQTYPDPTACDQVSWLGDFHAKQGENAFPNEPSREVRLI